MNKIELKLGRWSAVLCLGAFIIYVICFIGILATSPVYRWTNLQDYLVYNQSNSQFFKYLAQFFMLIFGPIFVILLTAINETAPQEKKILTRLGVWFALIFAALTGIHYFVQLSAARLMTEKGLTSGLEHFIQGNPYSFLSAVNMLGWTLFLGLASFFASFAFSGKKTERVIRIALLLNAIFCILGGIGYVLEIVILVFFTITFGMGAALMVASIFIYRYFSTLLKE